MDQASRRHVIALGAAAGMAGLAAPARAAGFGDPDEPPQGAANTAGDPASLTIPGPQNPALANRFPASLSPPATDVGDLPQFWASFNNAHRRIQEGGWARQVTQSDFAISTAISGVNMRLTAGGTRELHWHQAAEWAFMTYGTCRVTGIDPQGHSYAADVKQGDLWYFPAGVPHSLQGLGPDGAEFILCFDNGRQSEYDTLLVTDWLAHTPPDVLAPNFGLPAEAFAKISLHDRFIFQGQLPGPLDADREAIKSAAGTPPNPFTYSLAGEAATQPTKGGFVQVADSSNFKASTTVAAALVTVHPGGMREMHWHPNADEWQYYISGSAEMGVFNAGPKSATNDFGPGDIGYVPRNLGHYIRNTGRDDLVFLEVFRAASYQAISLSDWLRTRPCKWLRHI